MSVLILCLTPGRALRYQYEHAHIVARAAMRVSSDTKEETRRRILDVAHRLFARNGFAETTTRDIAGAAKIAAGTLFNYFPTKEALAASLVADALESAREETRTSPVSGETLEEDLFALMASTLRHLTPHRRYL